METNGSGDLPRRGLLLTDRVRKRLEATIGALHFSDMKTVASSRRVSIPSSELSFPVGAWSMRSWPVWRCREFACP